MPTARTKSKALPRADFPEQVGVSSKAISELLDDFERSQIELHSIMILRHGKVAFFTILFLVFGDRMGEVLFHNTLAGNFICQLSWLCPLLYVTSLLNSILHGLGNARQVLFVTLLACMIRICMILFLVPQYGIDAYLWGMLLSYVFAAIADILLLIPYSRAG